MKLKIPFSKTMVYVTDVHRVAKLAHKYGAKIIVDGAQIVAHRKFSMIGKTPEEMRNEE